MSEFVEMHTETMKEFAAVDPEELRSLQHTAEEAARQASEVGKAVREQFYFSLIKDIVENHYDIGTVEQVYQIFGGYINMTFGLYTVKDGQRQTWLFRQYKSGKLLDSLLFEHRLLTYAKQHGNTFVAAPLVNKEGLTYHQQVVKTEAGEEERLFAVFNYIDGEVKYDWIPNWAEEGLADATITSAARCMAEFHSFSDGFDPEGLHGDNIMDSEDSSCNDLIAKYPETLKKYRAVYEEAGLDNPYVELFDVTWPYYRDMCASAVIPAEDYEQMVICPCHCDFHAGNFKYYEDGTISGSFDYDMAKFDSRLFEIGLAMHYVFASWKLATDGVMRLDRVEKFIREYDAQMVEIGILPPLSDIEKKYLYEVIVQGTVYDYGWCTSAVMYDTTLDPYEYLYYSQHYLSCMKWLEAHEQEIRDLSARL